MNKVYKCSYFYNLKETAETIKEKVNEIDLTAKEFVGLQEEEKDKVGGKIIIVCHFL